MKLLTLARDLKRRKSRERHGLFVAEGIRTVAALLESELPVRGLLCTASEDPRLAELCRLAGDRGVPVLRVEIEELASAADTDAPQGILAIAEIPRRPHEGLPAAGDLLVLDAVQDPGNLGSIVRSAKALGVSAIVMLPGTVDVWNAKVVRSAMGALFTQTIVPLTWLETLDCLRQADIPLWVAAADGDPVSESVRTRPARVALVVANEGAGVSLPVAAAAARRVAIPMVAGTESLNVAVATGILLYVLRDGAH